LRDAFAVSATSLGEKAISTAATRENIRDQQVPLTGKIRKAQSAHMFPLHLRKSPLDFVVSTAPNSNSGVQKLHRYALKNESTLTVASRR
jgi:hypothetical protein